MISDSDLVARCIKGEQSAWSLFFTRYNRHIDQQIIRIFHFNYFPYTEEDFIKVKNDVIDLIQVREKLENITNKEDIKPWLATVSRNKTRDYIRRKKSIRSAYDQEVTRDMVSLQDPLKSGSDYTHEDMVSRSEEVDDNPEKAMAKKVLLIIDGMEEKYRIPMKLHLIFYCYPLPSSEISTIAKTRGISPETVNKQIEQLRDDLLKKHDQAIKAEETSIVLAAYIDRLKGRLNHLRRYPEDRTLEVIKIEKEIEKKEVRLEKLRNIKSNPIVPPNKKIATILRLKSGVVSIRLFRAKKMLKNVNFA